MELLEVTKSKMKTDILHLIEMFQLNLIENTEDRVYKIAPKENTPYPMFTHSLLRQFLKLCDNYINENCNPFFCVYSNIENSNKLILEVNLNPNL
ncbi:MAG: hypothetical protein KGV57_01375 [Fusobacterium sp.]|nr:hypothetical protein [Fusobacterium sp.]